MYLPRTLPLCEPHVATWIGASGRRYDFAVSRPAMTWLDEAAVFVLVKCEGERTDVLHVGHACSLQRRFGMARERCPELWRRALSAGMTHVHLRFEACSEQARQAEVDDLVAALHPALLIQYLVVEEAAAQPPPPLVEAVPAASEDVLIPYRARLKPTRGRDPHIDIDAFDLDLGRSDLPFGHAYEAPRLLRADPAREDGEGFDDFEAMLRDAQVASEPAAAVVVLPAQADVVEEAVAAQASDETVEAGPVAAPAAEGETGRVAPAAEEQPVGVTAEDAGMPAAQAVEPVPAEEPVQAVRPVATPQPAPRGGREGHARGRFGRWLHALAERSGRWLGASSRPQAAAEKARDTGPAAPLMADGEAAEAVVSSVAERNTAPAGAGAAALPPVAVDAAEMAAAVTGEVAEAEAPVAIATPALAMVAVVEEPPVETAVVETPDDTAEFGAVVVVATEIRGVFPDDLIAEAPAIAVIDLLDEDDDSFVPPAATVLADAAAMPAGEERQDTSTRRRAEDGSRGGASAPAFVAEEEGRAVVAAAKRACAFDPGNPVVLFADEVSPEAGADILADAIITVCATDGSAQFAFAGEGGLRGELQQRLWGAGLGERCRFLGDVPADRFERLLAAADILVVPARVHRGEELARMAVSRGKWVLATHQAGIACIQHGLNGLVTYDNPGSLVWGVRELLGRAGQRHQDARAEAA